MRPSEWLGERFWQHVDRSDPLGCWLWQGRRKSLEVPASHTYGRVSIEGRDYSAHHLAWMIFRGSTRGLWVLHKCDLRQCVNPHHLYLGTLALNTQDAVARGRLADWLTDDGEFRSWYDDTSVRDLLLDEDLRMCFAELAVVTVQRKRFDFPMNLADRTGESVTEGYS